MNTSKLPVGDPLSHDDFQTLREYFIGGAGSALQSAGTNVKRTREILALIELRDNGNGWIDRKKFVTQIFRIESAKDERLTKAISDVNATLRYGDPATHLDAKLSADGFVVTLRPIIGDNRSAIPLTRTSPREPLELQTNARSVLDEFRTHMVNVNSPPVVTLVHHSLAEAIEFIDQTILLRGTVRAYVEVPTNARSENLRKRIIENVGKLADIKTRTHERQHRTNPQKRGSIEVFTYDLGPSLRLTSIEYADQPQNNRLAVGHYIHELNPEGTVCLPLGHASDNLTLVANGDTQQARQLRKWPLDVCLPALVGKDPKAVAKWWNGELIENRISTAKPRKGAELCKQKRK